MLPIGPHNADGGDRIAKAETLTRYEPHLLQLLCSSPVERTVRRECSIQILEMP